MLRIRTAVLALADLFIPPASQPASVSPFSFPFLIASPPLEPFPQKGATNLNAIAKLRQSITHRGSCRPGE